MSYMLRTMGGAPRWAVMAPLLYIVALCGLGASGESDTDLVHKVHNVLLYPKKHAWCEARPIRMVVTHPGCQPIEINNHVCVGQCFSYSVPQTAPVDPGDDALHYCDTCRATKYIWMTVSLACNTEVPSGDDAPRQPISAVEKRVQLIQACECVACLLETPGGRSQPNSTRSGVIQEEVPSSSYSATSDDSLPPSPRDTFSHFLNNNVEEESQTIDAIPANTDNTRHNGHRGHGHTHRTKRAARIKHHP